MTGVDSVDRHLRKFLKFMRGYEASSPAGAIFQERLFEAYGKKNKLSNTEMTAMLNYLEGHGYVVVKTNTEVILEYKGRHPYRMAWQEIKETIVKSIFLPIGVSIATTLLTLLIVEIVQQLLK